MLSGNCPASQIWSWHWGHVGWRLLFRDECWRVKGLACQDACSFLSLVHQKPTCPYEMNIWGLVVNRGVGLCTAIVPNILLWKTVNSWKKTPVNACMSTSNSCSILPYLPYRDELARRSVISCCDCGKHFLKEWMQLFCKDTTTVRKPHLIFSVGKDSKTLGTFQQPINVCPVSQSPISTTQRSAFITQLLPFPVE